MTAPRAIDLTPLKRLLRMAGGAGAAALIAAFLDDLQTTRVGLDLAWNGPDFAALRTNSHVLIALAGTVGDTDLQKRAQRLNKAAHDQDTADLMTMKSAIMAELADLIDLLLRQQTPAGA